MKKITPTQTATQKKIQTFEKSYIFALRLSLKRVVKSAQKFLDYHIKGVVSNSNSSNTFSEGRTKGDYPPLCFTNFLNYLQMRLSVNFTPKVCLVQTLNEQINPFSRTLISVKNQCSTALRGVCYAYLFTPKNVQNEI